MINILTILGQLMLSALFGGLVGYERESLKRPAGFRTHMLVSIGATIAMQTNLYLFEAYQGMANVDPARLGAQVISGIGFLGAGTIIKEGATVKGLTTAASLWAVAVIGLAIGSAHYIPALMATLIIYFVLTTFQSMEIKMRHRKGVSRIVLTTLHRDDLADEVEKVLTRFHMSIDAISLNKLEGQVEQVTIDLRHPRTTKLNEIILLISRIDSITHVHLDE